MLPEDWKLTSLGKVCEGHLQTGPFGSQLHAYEYQETGVTVVMPKDIINCRVDTSKAAKITIQRAEDLKKHQLLAGDLLFSRRGDVTRFALIDEKSEGSLCGTGCLKARPSKNHSPIFLSYMLQRNTVKTWLEHNAVGQTMPNMNTVILTELPLISASSREEEDKIAQILSTWDKAIDKLEALIAAKQKRKKALMQQLLTGNTRLTKNNIDWKFGSFDDLFMVKNDKKTQVKSSDYLKSGVTPIIDQGQMTIAGFTNNETIYSDVPVIIFGDHTRIIKWIDYNFASGADGTQVLKTKKPLDLKFGFFLLSNVNLPSLGYSRHMKTLKEKEFKYPIDIKEQQKIASILTTADNEIVIHQNQLAALKQQKTGLMQQLLTGKVRVTV